MKKLIILLSSIAVFFTTGFASAKPNLGVSYMNTPISFMNPTQIQKGFVYSINTLRSVNKNKSKIRLNRSLVNKSNCIINMNNDPFVYYSALLYPVDLVGSINIASNLYVKEKCDVNNVASFAFALQKDTLPLEFINNSINKYPKFIDYVATSKIVGIAGTKLNATEVGVSFVFPE